MTKELADDLRKAALEIAAAGHAGWGNACTAGADAIEALQARVVELDRSETQLIQERDEREEVINALCDAVLGTDRYEWSSMYSFDDAVEEVAVKTAVLDKEVSELYALQARVAELEADKAAWIRRADKTWHEKHFTDQIAALTAELAAIKSQEPAAWFELNESLDAWFLAYSCNPKAKTRPLYTAPVPPVPPVREPLTDAEIETIARAHGTGGWQTLADMQKFARAIEAAIKEQGK